MIYFLFFLIQVYSEIHNSASAVVNSTGILNSKGILNSTVISKNIVADGIVHKYEVYEINYDKEIYYLENWVCPCANVTTNTYAPLLPNPAIELERNTISIHTSNSEHYLFRFYVDGNVNVDGDTPIIRIYIADNWDTGA